MFYTGGHTHTGAPGMLLVLPKWFYPCQLIPLDKGDTKEEKPGVRAVGVGKVIWCMVGKILIDVEG